MRLKAVFLSAFIWVFPIQLHAHKPCIQAALLGEFQRSSSKTAQPFGVEIARGAELAMNELKKKSTRLCPDLPRIDIKNSLSNIPDLLKKSVREQNIRVFIGCGISDQALVAKNALVGLPAVLITPTASKCRLSPSNHQLVMMSPNNTQIAKALAKATVHRGVKSVAILFSENSEYSKDIAQDFAREFSVLGGKVLLQVGSRLGAVPKDELLKLKTLQVDRIFLPLYELDSAKVISFLSQNGIHGGFIGSDSWGHCFESLENLYRGYKDRCFFSFSLLTPAQSY